MKFGQLIDCCIDIIQTYNPVVQTLDSYADEYLSRFDDAYQKMFIKQVFYGCIRYEQLLKAFNNILFKIKSSQTNRKDGTLYSIFCYISLFRLSDLNPDDFKRLVISQDSVKMNVFLQFLFNPESLRQHVRQQWMKHYDFAYIDANLIGGIQNSLPNVADTLIYVQKKATGVSTGVASGYMSQTNSMLNATLDESGTIKSVAGGKSFVQEQNQEEDDGLKKKKAPTIPKPFNLTKPKPKPLPMPEEIPKVVKRRQVPQSLYKTDLKQIEQQKIKRKEEIKQQTKAKFDAERAFAFATDNRPMKLQETKKRIEQERSKQIQFNKKHSKPMPNFDKKPAVVKVNTAAIVRQGYLLQKKKQQDEKKAKDFQMNLRDSTEFQRWQRQMEEQDNIKRTEHIQRKKIEMELAREEAIHAHQHKLKQNKLIVAQIKEKNAIQSDQLKHKIKKQLEKRKQVAVVVKDARVNVQIEQEKMKKKKKDIKLDIDKEIEQALQRKRQEDIVTQQRREEIIREIYEMERQKVDRTKKVDRDQVMGYGLLDELSLNQLKQRLEQNKQTFAEEVEKIRENNFKQKEENAQKLMNQAKIITQQRERKKQENQIKRQQKIQEKIEQERKAQEAKEKGMLEVYEKISEKKRLKKIEEQRLAKELKEIRLQRQYLNASKALVQEKAWKQLQSAKERQITDGQNDRLINQNKQNEIKLKALNIRAKNAKDAVRQKATKLINYDNDLQQRVKVKQRQYKENAVEKQAKFKKQRDFQRTAKQKRDDMYPYSATVNNTQKQLASTYMKEQTIKMSKKNYVPGIMRDSTLPPISQIPQNGTARIIGEVEGENLFEDQGNELSAIQKKLAAENV